MTGQQHAVMWMGLLLIVLRLFTTNQWATLKATFQSGEGKSSPGSSSGSSGGGGINLLPIPGLPTVHIPGTPFDVDDPKSTVSKSNTNTATAHV